MATRTGVAEPFWRRRKVQATALVLVLLLAWLASYLENLPLSRDAREAEAMVAARDEALRLDGIRAGEPITVQTTIAAERMVVSLPAGARMRFPEERAFQARARLEAAELAGLSYGNSIVLDAEPGAAESASLHLQFGPGSGVPALQWHRLSDDDRSLEWKVTAIGAPLKLTIELNPSPATEPAGTMILSRPDSVARVGQAEFELPEGSTLRLEVLRRRDATDASTAVVHLPGEASVLMVRAVELGTEGDPGELDVVKIACAAGTRLHLWSSLLSGVQPGQCTPHRLGVHGFDLRTGKVSIARRAFFQGFGATDTAQLISKLKGNLVFGYLLAAIAALAVPWVINAFRKPKTPRKRAPRAKSRSPKS